MEELKSIPLFLWIIIILILLTQATWMFIDASKRGEKKWLWGFFGLLNIPSNLLIYLLVTRVVLKSTPCSKCGKYHRVNSKFCPVCGTKQNISE